MKTKNRIIAIEILTKVLVLRDEGATTMPYTLAQRRRLRRLGMEPIDDVPEAQAFVRDGMYLFSDNQEPIFS